MQKDIVANPRLIAYCGLYCGACHKYLNGKCPGCAENTKATWCKVRSCNMENNYKSCADCKLTDFHTCKKLDNFIAKIFAVVFNSNRMACLEHIKKNGYDAFANDMTQRRKPTLPRK